MRLRSTSASHRACSRLGVSMALAVIWFLGHVHVLQGGDLEGALVTVQQGAFASNTAPAVLWLDPEPKPWSGHETPPVEGMKILARERGGALWLGSAMGAARFDPNHSDPWERWRYFYGRRWLPDNRIENITLQEHPSDALLRCWIRTAEGVSCLTWRYERLEAKAYRFEERIEARHVRLGYVTRSALGRPGDLTSSRQGPTDNDGLWTAIYLGSQCYHYAVTRSSQARRRARRALQAIMRLEAVTGIPGFYARTVVPADQPKPVGGEWHRSPDGRWWCKGDTSSDESVGHYFAYSTYYDLVADEQEKRAIQAVVRRMTDYLIAHDYELLDVDGRPTRWGRWSEAYFQTPEGRYEAALRSLELLSFLLTTWHITGDAKYQEAYLDRVRRGYARHMKDYRRWPGGGEINFSDDELAYLSYAPLLKYETDPSLRAIYLDGLRFTWSQVLPQKNPLWNYISVASGAGPLKPEVRRASRQTLVRIPEDMITWTMRNSHRRDVSWQAERDRFGQRQLSRVLAYDERAVEKWNANPYIPDGGDGGRSEDDGSYFLLPYWLGRYHGWVD